MNEEKKGKKETISYFKYVLVVIFAIGLSVLITINIMSCSLESAVFDEFDKTGVTYVLTKGILTDANGNPDKITFLNCKEGIVNVKVYYGEDESKNMQFAYDEAIKWPLNSLKIEELIFNEDNTQFTIASSTWEVVSGN